MVMGAFILNSIIGLVRQILVANTFGAGGELDAFNSANRVSETLFNLIAGGALASAFVPTFTALLTRKDQVTAWKLASALGNLVLLIMSVLVTLAAFFAPQIVRYALAPGFSNDPAQMDLTITLLRLMLPAAVIFAISGLVMGILNSNQIFLIPALAPALYQVGLILGLTVFRSWGIYGLAWGVIIGACLHLGIQLPSLFHLHGPYSPILGLEMASVREVIRLVLPRLFGVAVVQLNFWVNTNLASKMVEGSVSALTFGFALMLMAQVAIAQSVATAALPTFSAQFAQGLIDELRSTLANILRWLLLLSIPAALGLMFLSTPLVATLYQRGNFTSQDTALVAWALIWYAAGMVGHSLVEILARAFYSMHDTKTPVLVGIVAMTLNILLSIVFSAGFSRLGWEPLGGLALANSTATFLEMLVLLWIMRNRLKGLEGRYVAAGLFSAIMGSVIMVGILVAWIQVAGSRPDWLILFGGVLFSGVIYFGALYLMKVKEVRQINTGRFQAPPLVKNPPPNLGHQ